MPYAIHNVTRGRHNRTQRAAAAQHPRFKQHIGPGQVRLLRGRPLILSDDALQAHLEELRTKVAAGLVEVRTLDGRKVDLATLAAGPAPATPPLPRPPEDSIANDKPWGQRMPMHEGDLPDDPSIEPKLPALVAAAEDEDDAEEDDEAPGDEAAPAEGSPAAAAPNRAGRGKRGKR
jgi:hypothetical protein